MFPATARVSRISANAPSGSPRHNKGSRTAGTADPEALFLCLRLSSPELFLTSHVLSSHVHLALQ